MESHLSQKRRLDQRLSRLMFLRVAIATFLLGIAAFIQIKGTKTLPDASISWVYYIIITTYLLSFLYLVLSRKIESLEVNVHIQALCDVALITVLVYLTGGIGSIYSVLYSLVIIYSGLFLTKKGAITVASASSISYGLLLDLQYYGVIQPLYGGLLDYDPSAGYVLSRIFIHIVSFYIIAFLISFVVEQEKRSRALLAEKESEFYQLDLLYKSIIESVNAGIITIDLQGNIKSFNRAAEQITSFSFSEVEGKKIDSVFAGFFEILAEIKGKKKDGHGIDRGETVVSGKQKKKTVLGFSVSSLIGSKDNKIGNIVIFQDLTGAKEMEKEIEKTRSLALIGEMAASLAHEVRNPLASISGSIQLLEMNLDLGETNKKLMEIILRGRDQLENLVKNFLLLARLDRSNREEIDINDVVDDVLESLLFSPDWQDNIEVERKNISEARIHGNKTEVRQMFWNLVLNAVQSMPDGGRLKIEARFLPAENGKKCLEIRISDTGCGIDRDIAGKMFTPFYTTKERGTGLGLTIASRIADSHGGKIEIQSELDKGTSCMLLLPLRGGISA